jgi:hypothetical protein
MATSALKAAKTYITKLEQQVSALETSLFNKDRQIDDLKSLVKAADVVETKNIVLLELLNKERSLNLVYQRAIELGAEEWIAVGGGPVSFIFEKLVTAAHKETGL